MRSPEVWQIITNISRESAPSIFRLLRNLIPYLRHYITSQFVQIVITVKECACCKQAKSDNLQTGYLIISFWLRLNTQSLIHKWCDGLIYG